MFEKRLSPLALYAYAGQDIAYPVISLRAAPACQALSYICAKVEHALNLLQPPENKYKTHTNLEANDQNSKRGRLN